MKTTATNRKLRQLLTGIKNGTLLPRPEFQRRLVWANKHKVSFLQTVIEQYPFPEIYLASGHVNPDTGDGTEMLVDGQQRITTLYQYFIGSSGLKLSKGIRPYVDLSHDEKIAFLEYEVVVRDLGKMSIDEIKEIFKRINSTNYALNAMEISNARFEGELKSFAERMAQNVFFEKHSIFSGAELRRMLDLRFVLNLIVTLMSSYFNRDDSLEEYLGKYNDEFEEASEIESRLNAALGFVDACDFSPTARVWKKSDLFTLIVEVDRAQFRHKKILDPALVRQNMEEFYAKVESVATLKTAEKFVVQYYRASLQATNDRASRVRRGAVIQLILAQEKKLVWDTKPNTGTEDIVEEMIEWFFENYEDPAQGVYYDSGEGGYQYLSGGPYDADDVLSQQFESVPRYLIDMAVERIQSAGWEWVKKGEY